MNSIVILIGIALIVCAFFLFFINKGKYFIFLLACLILLPKVNIIQLSSGTSAGLRSDDILLLLNVILCIIGYKKFLSVYNTSTKGIIHIYLLYFLMVFFSFLIGLFNDTWSISLAVFSVVRKIEYFSTFLIGYFYFVENKNFSTLYKTLKKCIILLFLISILQVTNNLGSFTAGSYQSEIYYLNRASGTFNAPYEFGHFLIMILPLFLYNIINKSNINKKLIEYVSFTIILILMILWTSSRTSIIIMLIELIVTLFKIKKTYVKVTLFGTIAVIGIIFILVGGVEISQLDRFDSLNINNMISSFIEEWNRRDFQYYIDYTISGGRISSIVNNSGDVSTTIRFFKWSGILDGLLNNPLYLLFGFGYGVTLVVDGNFIRMLGENGIIGLFIFIILLIKCYKDSNRLKSYDQGFVYFIKWIVIGLLIASVMIDIFEASKVMEPFWFFIGAMYSAIRFLDNKRGTKEI